MTVPEHLLNALSRESLIDGFLARFLIFEASDTPPRQDGYEVAIPSGIIDTARYWGNWRATGNLGSEFPQPRLIEQTAEAKEIFSSLGQLADKESSEGDCVKDALWARAEEKACRLAIVYACSRDHLNPIIDKEATAWACELSDYLTRRMLFLADTWVSENQFDQRQKEIMRYIWKKKGKIKKWEFNRKFRCLTPKEREELILNLIETGHIRIEVLKTKGTTATYFVAIGNGVW